MTFRIGLTRDLLKADGQAIFGAGPLSLLQNESAIEWEFLPETLVEITSEVMARYDGLYVNSPRVSAASVSHADCRVKIVSRHGVGYDSVDVKALADKGIITTNTPVAVRRPVAVAALTLIFALAGRLLTKDQLTREGSWHDRTNHMGLGLTTRTLGVIGAGGIGQELLALARPFGWRMLSEAYDRKGQPGMARLMAAEQFFALGSPTEARVFAMRAREALTKNSPEWRRATDIVLTSEPTDQDLKDLAKEGSTAPRHRGKTEAAKASTTPPAPSDTKTPAPAPAPSPVGKS
jgi:hypothetical protein